MMHNINSYIGRFKQPAKLYLDRVTKKNQLNTPVKQTAFYATQGTAVSIILEQAKIPIETKQGITYKKMSIGIRNGIISQIGQFSSKEYDHKLNVGGKLVTPGLLIHIHIYFILLDVQMNM